MLLRNVPILYLWKGMGILIIFFNTRQFKELPSLKHLQVGIKEKKCLSDYLEEWNLNFEREQF